MTTDSNTGRRLSDADLAAIAWADARESARSIAERLGVKAGTVDAARRRIQTHGFGCALHWTTCQHCGEPLAGRIPGQRFHYRCQVAAKHAHDQHYGTTQRARDANRRWRQNNPEAVAIDYRRKLARRQAAQEHTRETVERVHVRWTLDAGRWTLDAGRWTLEEDTQIIDARNGDLPAIAMRLGRSLYAVNGRRHRLRTARRDAEQRAT